MNDDTIRKILNMKTIAVVGMSAKPERPSHGVAMYLLNQGYRIIPVNPGQDEINGLKSYPTLQDIPHPVDVVDVFRKSDFCEPIARAAVEIGAKALWLQEGITNDKALKIAEEAGLMTVQNRCMLKEHRRLMG